MSTASVAAVNTVQASSVPWSTGRFSFSGFREGGSFNIDRATNTLSAYVYTGFDGTQSFRVKLDDPRIEKAAAGLVSKMDTVAQQYLWPDGGGEAWKNLSPAGNTDVYRVRIDNPAGGGAALLLDDITATTAVKDLAAAAKAVTAVWFGRQPRNPSKPPPIVWD